MVAEKERLEREVVAMRVAKELPDGGFVNLGIGIPTLVSNFIPEGSVVFYHSESGVLNCGPLAEEAEQDIDLINAGGQFLQQVPGMAFFSTADGFAMIRGGHVDVTVLGAHQVSATGDLANWMLPERGVGNIGGAYRPAERGQDCAGLHLSHHRQGLCVPHRHRYCGDGADAGRVGIEGSSPGLVCRRGSGVDRRPADYFAGLEGV